MVRGDIIGGIKIALSRGQSLQDAMQSFYNAGYKKEEIMDAARTLKNQGFVPEIVAEKPKLGDKKSQEQTQQVSIPSITPSAPSLKPVAQKPKTPIPATAPIPKPQTPTTTLTHAEPQLQVKKEHLGLIPQPTTMQTKSLTPIKSKPEEKKSQIPLPPPPLQRQVPKQVVSAYAQPEKKRTDFLTILLVVILLLLVGVLIGVFFFREAIVEFLTKVLE